MIDFSNTLFRCSSLGHIMTEPKSKADKDAGNLSETAKTHLIDIFVSKKYNRQNNIQNKYIQKGLMVEEDSITLYSRVKKQFFKKNKERISNEFITGEPDLYEGTNILKADVIIDAKSSWDIFTFFRTKTKPVNSDYYWQGQGYMALTGAKKFILAYCLVNTPGILINDEKRRLLYKMGVATEENEDFIQACEELERLMKYDDIPMQERVIEFEIERNEDDIQAACANVIKCRKYLNELEQSFSPVLKEAV